MSCAACESCVMCALSIADRSSVCAFLIGVQAGQSIFAEASGGTAVIRTFCPAHRQLGAAAMREYVEYASKTTGRAITDEEQAILAVAGGS